MAIVVDEPEAGVCMSALEREEDAAISAGTLAEALIVARRRGVGPEMSELINGLGLRILPIGAQEANRAAAAYDRWGKGIDRAALNFGDCFAYAAAAAWDCPLLFVGRDFAQIDLVPAV